MHTRHLATLKEVPMKSEAIIHEKKTISNSKELSPLINDYQLASVLQVGAKKKEKKNIQTRGFPTRSLHKLIKKFIEHLQKPVSITV